MITTRLSSSRFVSVRRWWQQRYTPKYDQGQTNYCKKEEEEEEGEEGELEKEKERKKKEESYAGGTSIGTTCFDNHLQR